MADARAGAPSVPPHPDTGSRGARGGPGRAGAPEVALDLELALDAGGLAPWSWDVATGRVRWSARIERMHGMAEGAFPGTLEAFRASVHPGDRARVEAEIARTLAERRPEYRVRYRYLRADTPGSDAPGPDAPGPDTPASAERWLEGHGRLVLDAAGAPARLLGVVADITDRVRADAERERLLAESEAARAAAAESASKFRFALAVADLGAWDLDLTTRRAWRSLRHDQIFGYDALLPEWTYERFLAHVVPEDRARVDAAYGGALAAASPWDFTCRIRRADGAERWIAARGEPIRDAAGVPVRLVGVVRDVTAAREAEAALRAAVAAAEAARGEAEAARSAAEAASRAKSEFLAVMSHELRTPLNAIGGYAELLELGIRGPVTAQQREDLARIQASQRHLLGLINEVLNYARLESGAVRYAVADVHVCDVLQAAEGLVAPQARAKAIALAVADCPTDLRVRADPDKLRQVLLNLLANAVKFTDRGGAVDVSCEATAGRVAVRVRDTGIGIPADKLAAVFEPFVQVRSDLTRPHEGAGLGLAISRDLARGMGGDLTAESTPGVGSTFTLTLPGAAPTAG